jgi:hypothetical protein
MEREMRGRVARHREHLERDACELDRLASGEQDVGRVRAKRHAGRREAGRILEQHPLALGHVHGCTRSFRQVGDAEEVVPVAVRHEDRLAAGAEARERQAELGRITARVDDHGIA